MFGPVKFFGERDVNPVKLNNIYASADQIQKAIKRLNVISAAGPD